MQNEKKQRPSSTLCIDCIHAVDGHACPWVNDFTPVDGWWAIESRVAGNSGYDSFHVINCPLCDKDAFGSGAEWRLGFPKRDGELSNGDAVELAARIVEQAVADWKALPRGVSDLRFIGQIVWRADLIEFFNGKWFEKLLGMVTTVDPDLVREKLGVPKYIVTRKGASG